MSVIVELSIFPMDKGESVSVHVARVVKIIRASGLGYSLGPMGTCIEGRFGEVMAVVEKCFRELETDCARIYFTVKGDYRRGREKGLAAKTASVEGKLGT